MQTWAKRGLQTALVTGGLLMLGTGIASADEDVNPDRPASPLDQTLTVPVPGSQQTLTASTSDIPAVEPLFDRVKQVVSDTATTVTGKIGDDVTSFAGDARDQAVTPNDRDRPLADRLRGVSADDHLADAPLPEDEVHVPGLDAQHRQVIPANHVEAGTAVPVDLSGAAGRTSTALRRAEAVGDTAAHAAHHVLAGNDAQLEAATPVPGFGHVPVTAGAGGLNSTVTEDKMVVSNLAPGAGAYRGPSDLRTPTGGNLLFTPYTPVVDPGQAYGGSAAELDDAFTESVTSTGLDGGVDTSGDSALVSGYATGPQAMPLAQDGATAASGVGGLGSSTDTNEIDAVTGGAVDPGGDSGVFSGDLLDVVPVEQPSAAGRSNAAGDAAASGRSGRDSLSGVNVATPVSPEGKLPTYDIPASVLALAMADPVSNNDLQVGDAEPQMLQLPVSGTIEANEVPSYTPPARSLPKDPTQGMFSGALGGFPRDIPADLQTRDLPSLATDGVSVSAPQVLPAPVGRSDTLPLDTIAVHDAIGGLLPGRLGGERDMSTLTTRDLGNLLSPLSAFNPAGFGYTQTPLRYGPLANDLDATTIIPALNQGDLSDITTVLPVIPHQPAMAAVPAAAGPVSQSSLDSTRAALANLFTATPIG